MLSEPEITNNRLLRAHWLVQQRESELEVAQAKFDASRLAFNEELTVALAKGHVTQVMPNTYRVEVPPRVT